MNCGDIAPTMVGKLLLINAGLLLVYMTACFFAAKQRKRLDTVDISWGLGFALISLVVAAAQPSTRSTVIAILVSIWGLRLAYHIFQRSRKHPEGDPRYQELSGKWKGHFWSRAYVSVFLVQAVLIFIVGLPIMMATGRELDGWSWLTYVGTAIWLTGFLVEVIGDLQLRNFLAEGNHPKVLQTGLWRYSRHPNYFGELVQWWGIAVIALQASFGWVGLAGPLLLSILIIFVSGIPPIERRRLKDPAYKAYKQRTSPLIPLPTRKTKG